MIRTKIRQNPGAALALLGVLVVLGAIAVYFITPTYLGAIFSTR